MPFKSFTTKEKRGQWAWLKASKLFNCVSWEFYELTNFPVLFWIVIHTFICFPFSLLNCESHWFLFSLLNSEWYWLTESFTFICFSFLFWIVSHKPHSLCGCFSKAIIHFHHWPTSSEPGLSQNHNITIILFSSTHIKPWSNLSKAGLFKRAKTTNYVIISPTTWTLNNH